jgi:hypothetical protein
MAIYGYTKNYKLIKPQFDTDTWHDYIYDNLDTIDAVLSAIFASGDWQGFWKSNTHYDVGGVVIDRATDTMYKVMVEHTTSEATFAEEFAAHPTYYELWSPNNLAESWAIKMDDKVSNEDYSSKAYAVSSGLIDDGSAQEWAIKSGTIGTTGEYSAKKYANDASLEASAASASATFADSCAFLSYQWAVSTTLVASTDYSAKAYAISSALIGAGSAKEWATKTGGTVGTTNEFSAKEYSTESKNYMLTAKQWATSTTVVEDGKYGASYYALQAYNANVSAQAAKTTAQEWASKMDGQVASTDYSSKYYAGQSATSANNSHIWAEGTDAQVQALGGVHSSKVWAEQSTNANIALTNSPYTTNRILEIPQDIKLELNNGTLTLKAGSKVYVPNGFEADGTTPKFDVVMIESDIVANSWSSNGSGILFLTHAGACNLMLNSRVYSGNTQPTVSAPSNVWYDTTNNLIKVTYNSGSTWIPSQSLPLCYVSWTYNNGTSTITSIDQIFNGFGYIGSTVFVLPGVKCQSSTGRNVDGTCISPVRTISSVSTYEAGNWNNATLYFLLWTETCEGQDVRRFTRNKEFSSQSATYSFDENENKWYYSNNSQTWNDSGFVVNIVGKFVIASGKITSFEPYTVDSVLNSNLSNLSAVGQAKFDAKADKDLSNLTNGLTNTICTTPATTTSTASSARPAVVVENYKNGNSWYRVWSDGFIEQGGRVQINASTYADVSLLKPYSNTDYMISFSHSLLGTSGQAESYALKASGIYFRLGNGCGTSQYFTWTACGY